MGWNVVWKADVQLARHGFASQRPLFVLSFTARPVRKSSWPEARSGWRSRTPRRARGIPRQEPKAEAPRAILLRGDFVRREAGSDHFDGAQKGGRCRRHDTALSRGTLFVDELPSFPSLTRQGPPAIRCPPSPRSPPPPSSLAPHTSSSRPDPSPGLPEPLPLGRRRRPRSQALLRLLLRRLLRAGARVVDAVEHVLQRRALRLRAAARALRRSGGFALSPLRSRSPSHSRHMAPREADAPAADRHALLSLPPTPPGGGRPLRASESSGCQKRMSSTNLSTSASLNVSWMNDVSKTMPLPFCHGRLSLPTCAARARVGSVWG